MQKRLEVGQIVNTFGIKGEGLLRYLKDVGSEQIELFAEINNGLHLLDWFDNVFVPDDLYYIVSNALNAIINADTLIVAGTSLTVQPASGLIMYFKGKNLVLINRDETPYDYRANLVIHEKLGEVFVDGRIINLDNLFRDKLLSESNFLKFSKSNVKG